MKLDLMDFNKISYLSDRDIAFQTNPQKFADFLSVSFSKEGFKQKIEQRKKYPINRSLLTDVIKKRYAQAGIDDLPISQIEALQNENTFTVITAHQPSLLTGPLYFIYKILSVINLAEQLSAENEDYKILPVFILGSEDHDFEEINHLQLFGNKIEWESDQGGSVGKMNTETLDPVLEKVYEIIGSSENAESLKTILKSSFKDASNYNTAVLRMVHELFKKYNLLIVLTDDVALKSSFKKHIENEILNQPSQELIQKEQDKLEKIGFKPQAHAREINFFYLQDGRRDRIVKDGDEYKINGTTLSFTETEIKDEINSHPERFSPNVVMRPIYQEHVLPNLAYLGGGGEIAYWTERKTQFEHFETSFPILIRRNSVLWINNGDKKLLDKYNISIEDIFGDEEELVKTYVKSQSSEELEFTSEFELFNQAFDSLASKAKNIDSSLASSIDATKTKQFKSFEQLSSRLIRAEKDKYERDISKIRKLKNRLFPNNSLQERKDNFIPFYLKHGESYFDIIKENLDPFDQSFVIISEES